MKTFLINLFIVMFALLTLTGCFGLVFIASVALVGALGVLVGVILSIVAGAFIGGGLFGLFVWIIELIFE